MEIDHFGVHVVCEEGVSKAADSGYKDPCNFYKGECCVWRSLMSWDPSSPKPPSDNTLYVQFYKQNRAESRSIRERGRAMTHVGKFSQERCGTLIRCPKSLDHCM